MLGSTLQPAWHRTARAQREFPHVMLLECFVPSATTYTLSNHDTCMEPLFADADTLVADPAWSVEVGDPVVIHWRAACLPAGIKVLIEPLPPPSQWTEKTLLVVRTLNPAEVFDCPLTAVAAVHRVKGPVLAFSEAEAAMATTFTREMPDASAIRAAQDSLSLEEMAETDRRIYGPARRLLANHGHELTAVDRERLRPLMVLLGGSG